MIKMNKNLFSVFVLICTILVASSAYSTEISSFYRGIRPLGMGNAFTAIANDENSMYYNPAGLNNIEGFGSIGIINPAVNMSESLQSFVDDLNDVPDNDVSASTQLIRDYIGVHQHGSLSLMPHYAVHNFGIAVLAQGTVDMDFRNKVNPYVETKMIYDIVPTVSSAFSFLNDKLKTGVTVKYFQRKGIVKKYAAVDIASDNFDPENDMEEGSGFGIDLGLIYNLPFIESLNPTVGLVVQNLGDVDLGDAGKEPEKVNMGLGVNYTGLKLVEILAAFDYVDITNNVGDDSDMAKRLHMGVEAKFPMVSVRAGLNQGYSTYGATLNVWILKIEYAAYTEELGAYAGQRRDKRQMIQVSLGWY